MLMSPVSAQQETVRSVIDKVPFDRITLTEANDGAVIDAQLLDLAERKVPDPLPASGTLKLRRMNDPSTQYEVSWTDVAKVELYEQLVLQEATELVKSGKLNQAFESLAYLHDNYPKLMGLQELTEQYLQQDAKAAYENGKYDESLAILAALYDENPQHAGIARAVEGISDRMINEQLASRDFAGARELLESLPRLFPDMPLTNTKTWHQKFNEGAERQLDAARRALAANDFETARRDIQHALAIVPNLPGVKALLAELRRRAPQIEVGVMQRALVPNSVGLHTWADERVGRLTNPQFVELVRVGPDGGEYACRWADFKVDDSGLRLEMRFNDLARGDGITPEAVALQLVRMADNDSPLFRSDFANVFNSAEIRDGQSLIVNWRYAHVKPEALLGFSLAEMGEAIAEGVAYTAATDSETSAITTYRLTSDTVDPAISEKQFSTDEQEFDALQRGDLDVVDQVPPWQISRVKQVKELAIGTYRLPTVHVLLCNYANPLFGRREFRRALCYAIDRPRLAAEILAGKEATPGVRALSGPLLAGIRANDAIGYAYKQELQPLPYEPRLAVVLATTARTTLAKQALAKAGEKNRAPIDLPKPEPLVLVHANDAVARTMCGLIKRQLDAVGIPIELREQTAAAETHWDLKYSELCLWEPVVDARKLLGPGGLAGNSSPAMILALEELSKSTNWSEARTRLQQIHQLAYDELPVIPLWQTINSFAYRSDLAGVTRDPVSLYQDVAQWRISYDLAENKR